MATEDPRDFVDKLFAKLPVELVEAICATKVDHSDVVNLLLGMLDDRDLSVATHCIASIAGTARVRDVDKNTFFVFRLDRPMPQANKDRLCKLWADVLGDGAPKALLLEPGMDLEGVYRKVEPKKES